MGELGYRLSRLACVRLPRAETCPRTRLRKPVLAMRWALILPAAFLALAGLALGEVRFAVLARLTLALADFFFAAVPRPFLVLVCAMSVMKMRSSA